MASLSQKLLDFGGKVYKKVDKMLGGAPSCVAAAYGSFNRVRGPEAAASLAYYALFSLFPLLLVLIAGGSAILKRSQVEGAVLQYAGRVLPVPVDVLKTNLDAAIRARGPIGLIGFISLLWSAMGVFNALAVNINLAWTNARARNFFMKPIIGLLMIFLLVLMVLASLLVSFLLDLLIKYRSMLNLSVSVYESDFWKLLSLIVSLALVFLTFLSMYKFVPHVRSRWRSAFWGALAATLLSLLVTRLFAWYLSSGRAHFDLVYGSLGTVIALLFLIYLLATITLFGAHLSAAFGYNPAPPEPGAKIDPTVEPAQKHDPVTSGIKN